MGSPIDYILAFTSQDTAKTDQIIGTYWNIPSDISPGGWAGNVIPNINVTVNGTGTPMQITDQNGNIINQIGPDLPLDNLWRILIMTKTTNQDLDSHPNLELCADRELALSGVPRSQFILFPTTLPEIFSGVTVSPTPAGSAYLFT
jgi:hypothetical protein